MSSWARLGVRCVCIRKTPWIHYETFQPTDFGPHYNQQLTIAAIVEGLNGPQLHFAEYPIDPDGKHRPCYPLPFFRPLNLIGDDVALFAHHLRDVSEPA